MTLWHWKQESLAAGLAPCSTFNAPVPAMGTGAAKTETQTDKVAMVSAKKPKAKPEFRFRPVFLILMCKLVKEVRY
jgi:hypothetical protein